MAEATATGKSPSTTTHVFSAYSRKIFSEDELRRGERRSHVRGQLYAISGPPEATRLLYGARLENPDAQRISITITR